MKAYKLVYETPDWNWDKIYLTEEGVRNGFSEIKEENKCIGSFEEFGDQCFALEDVNCEWYDINIEGEFPKPLIYLASPYTGNEQPNFEAVAKKAAELMTKGYIIFSPISMCHPMSVYGKIPGDWKFWEKFDRTYLSVCNRIMVYRLPGWEKSKGVAAEIKIAQEFGIPVEYID